jgi:hypothetical protein
MSDAQTAASTADTTPQQMAGSPGKLGAGGRGFRSLAFTPSLAEREHQRIRVNALEGEPVNGVPEDTEEKSTPATDDAQN